MKELLASRPHGGDREHERAPVTKLVIDRSRWLRGEGVDNSYLLRPSDGKMCCLGFFARALGADPDSIEGQKSPDKLPLFPWPDWLLNGITKRHTTPAGCLMEENDSRHTVESERERLVAHLFAEHGVTVEFIDGPPPDQSSPPKAKE